MHFCTQYSLMKGYRYVYKQNFAKNPCHINSDMFGTALVWVQLTLLCRLMFKFCLKLKTKNGHF